ncbi:MAG: translation elongation factor 4 [Myxococcota bacterium]|nr:translation elongation factor 4 [Myxococcota bacterium]
MQRIRNFAIIAHIDHGKSTLADRILDHTHSISERDARAQFLDSMELERERGITIKAQAVRLRYVATDGIEYTLDLIDTPGHVDFHYEVSRSLAACEGALLVVDAVQGVEAQTLANVYLALEHDLEIIPVINKIDLPAADVERVKGEIEDFIGIDASSAIAISAKADLNIDAVLEALVRLVPAPRIVLDAPLRALVFDSWFDSYRGVIALVRVVDGALRVGDRIKMMASGCVSEVVELGYNTPYPRSAPYLCSGEVGFIVSMVKDLAEVQIGDTLTSASAPASAPLTGFKRVQPMVFAGIYPIATTDYELLRNALAKLVLNDAALQYEAESSEALGFGFRCGFLGLLHMEIVQERIEREYGISPITTAPTTIYRVHQRRPGKGVQVIDIDTPSKLPRVELIERIEEPYINAKIHVPSDWVGAILALCQGRRGIHKKLSYGSSRHVVIEYELPLAEVLFDFFDKLKSCSRGYASLDYELCGYREADLVKLDILVNGDPLDALSIIVHRDMAYARGKELIAKLRKLIPRQQFDVPLQAAVGSRVIARETIPAMRKNVTAKCYGGDITRKRKLLERQKEGKRRMKMVGTVEIPQEAFLAVLQADESDD